jgi:hypothetical protein
MTDLFTSWPDIINGLFEVGGSLILMANLKAIREDKCLKGVRWYPTGFFTAWGLWNLFYYPSLDQWVSFAGGALMVFVNAMWLAHVWYYRNGPVVEEPEGEDEQGSVAEQT